MINYLNIIFNILWIQEPFHCNRVTFFTFFRFQVWHVNLWSVVCNFSKSFIWWVFYYYSCGSSFTLFLVIFCDCLLVIDLRHIWVCFTFSLVIFAFSFSHFLIINIVALFWFGAFWRQWINFVADYFWRLFFVILLVLMFINVKLAMSWFAFKTFNVASSPWAKQVHLVTTLDVGLNAPITAAQVFVLLSKRCSWSFNIVSYRYWQLWSCVIFFKVFILGGKPLKYTCHITNAESILVTSRPHKRIHICFIINYNKY